MKQPIKILFQQ